MEAKERTEEPADDEWMCDETIFACKFGHIKFATHKNEIDIYEACKWLENNAYLFVNDNTGSINEQDLIEEFRKAMKGE